jgi:hypothetical protein
MVVESASIEAHKEEIHAAMQSWLEPGISVKNFLSAIGCRDLLGNARPYTEYGYKGSQKDFTYMVIEELHKELNMPWEFSLSKNVPRRVSLEFAEAAADLFKARYRYRWSEMLADNNKRLNFQLGWLK